MVLAAVITTIQPPTEEVKALHRRLSVEEGVLIVAGDTAGPQSFDLPGVKFLDIEAQRAMPFALPNHLPEKHYARKNAAYLEAIASGAQCIYETDDDNAPLKGWAPRQQVIDRGLRVAAPAQDGSRWVNVYKYFTRDNIWPRGLPLDELTTEPPSPTPASGMAAPIQQGLADGSPDVDAVWRLTMDRPFCFQRAPSVYLDPGNWCPFNTQSTWWWPVAYPLLYIPSHCSFRMCDIWKSFVAQRCLWAMGLGVVFHAPEVFQERNEHNLMKDFEDEVPGYLNNARIAEVLDGLSLSGVPADDLRVCYCALVNEGFFPEAELELVDLWCSDLEGLND